MELEETVKRNDRLSRMSKNIILTVTLATALTYTGCGPSGDGKVSDDSGKVYNEVRADSVKTHNGIRTFYYFGRPYTQGTMHSDGTEFHPSASGRGGYFARPGVHITPRAAVRGGFGSIGGGRSGAT